MTKSPNGFRIGIVNPLTMVGTDVKALLFERGLHYDQIDLLDDTGEAGGALTEVGDEAAVVQELSEMTIEPLDIVFFCGSGETNARWIAYAEESECLAIDVSSPPYDPGDGIPVVAGVNDEDLVQPTGRVISAHPAAIPLILIADRVRALTPIRTASAAVIQPASQFGKEGIDELFQQTIQALNMEGIPQEVFDRQAAFNLFPADNALSVESLVRQQMAAILGTVPMAVSVIQGPTFHGHGISMFVETEDEVTADELRKALSRDETIQIEDDTPASIIDAGGRDAVLIGRVSKDPNVKNGYWIWAACDNLRRGAALNAVLIAETVIRDFEWAN